MVTSMSPFPPAITSLREHITDLHHAAGKPSERSIATAVQLSASTVHVVLTCPERTEWTTYASVAKHLAGLAGRETGDGLRATYDNARAEYRAGGALDQTVVFLVLEPADNDPATLGRIGLYAGGRADAQQHAKERRALLAALPVVADYREP